MERSEPVNHQLVMDGIRNTINVTETMLSAVTEKVRNTVSEHLDRASIINNNNNNNNNTILDKSVVKQEVSDANVSAQSQAEEKHSGGEQSEYSRSLPVHAINHKRQKRQTLHDMTRPLKEWLQAHTQNPYPSKSEKISLALNANMTLTQVSNWFANARRRLKNTSPEPDVTWAKRRGSHGNHNGSCSDESNMESDEERAPEVVNTQYPLTMPTLYPTYTQHPLVVEPQMSPALPQQMPPAQPTAAPQTDMDQTVPDAPYQADSAAPYQPEVRPVTPVTEEEDIKPVVKQEHAAAAAAHPGKYKRSILQRYLNDAYKHTSVRIPGAGEEGRRERNLSGSLSSYDYEEVSSFSSHGSPARETQETEHCTEEDFGKWSSYPVKREHDDLYWKEIGAALALTSLARCHPHPMSQEQ